MAASEQAIAKIQVQRLLACQIIIIAVISAITQSPAVVLALVIWFMAIPDQNKTFAEYSAHWESDNADAEKFIGCAVGAALT